MKPKQNRSLLVLLPSLRISGGVQETLRLADALVHRGVSVRVLVFWKHNHESPLSNLPVYYLSDFMPRKTWAAFQFPLLLLRFMFYVSKLRKDPEWNFPALLLTHFSTFPFAWCAPGLRRFCFNQDLEWKFVPTPLRALVRWLILFTSKRSGVITTNNFVSHSYIEAGVTPFAQVSLWASAFWSAESPPPHRPFDIVMLLRHGAVKRPDLYFELLYLLRKETSLRCAVITPETALYNRVRSSVEHAQLRPSNQELRDLFGISKIFVLLSDTEGFGLPPLEAMGTGCVPFCRDSGGVRCYMHGPLAANLVPIAESTAEILARLQRLLSHPDELADLSRIARARFQDGLAESETERNAAYDRISEALNNTPPN
jgi:glycosyltransferase involved in cell wall biosynthesis